MANFSVPLESLLSGITSDAITNGTGPVILVRRSDNGVVTVLDKNRVSVTSGAATTTVDANGATVNLLIPGVAKVALGTTPTTMKFINMAAVTLTGGVAAATIMADTGSNTFISGKGPLTITGGAGADSYVYHTGSALMTIQDFSVAKGDVLMIDKTLQGSMSQTSDNQGGTMVSFGSAAVGIDVKGMATFSPTSIHWI
jgi:Ca2+-binding RTX toxin-like protein